MDLGIEQKNSMGIYKGFMNLLGMVGSILVRKMDGLKIIAKA